MNLRRRTLSAALLAFPGLPRDGVAQPTPGDGQQPAASAANLYAVEFRTGAKWDPTKQAHEQAHFREHSANLKRLRDGGQLLIGARYADKGFIVVAAESEFRARALIDIDPSVQNQVFAYDVHAFNVFYPGCVQSPKRTA